MLSYYPVNCTLPGMRPDAFGARTNEELRAVNAALRGLAQELGCRYVDVSTCLEDEAGNLRADYTIEGMHLYAGAYRVVLDALLPHLLEA